tara:strand:- start:5331 stop:6629 length:1299 start_codon:yes stop_codon:yes gene_type:complete
MKKKVYLAFSADFIHRGHIKILKMASKLGRVIVGILTDEAINSFKKIPLLNFNQRKLIFENLKLVDEVVVQKTLDYRPNLRKIKPEFVVHGDDWKRGVLRKTRSQVVSEIKKWSGKLIEPKYTKDISSSEIRNQIDQLFKNKNNRTSFLKRLIDVKDIVRIVETHSPLASILAEKKKYISKNEIREFDGFWSSSLTDSLLRGKPDNQSVDLTKRILGIDDIMDVTSKPLIIDADNGGRIEHIGFTVKTLERIGVSAMIIEDKKGLKRNSLFGNQSGVKQDSIKDFCKKIKEIKKNRLSKDFLIIPRIESLILNNGIDDALKRAINYSKAGADLIMIHSKKKKPNEIYTFSKKFKKSKFFIPLVSVPTSYSKTYEKNLIKNGFKIVIYANHLLRASYFSMNKTLESILKHGRSYESEKNIEKVSKLLEYSDIK